jgi:hypothetical protein
MQFARDAGCDSMILTGVTEPQQNFDFIYNLLKLNKTLRTPFYNITLQTCGTMIDSSEFPLMSLEGITTLALSISSFDDQRNWDIIQAPAKVRTCKLRELIWAAKESGMNVRACVNLTDEFNDYTSKDFFNWAIATNVDQLTFRKIYAEGNTPQAQWVRAHQFDPDKWSAIKNYVKYEGTPIRLLPFGAILYDVSGIGVVVDDDCMAKKNIEEVRYYVLRANNKLYSLWDAKGSLVY